MSTQEAGRNTRSQEERRRAPRVLLDAPCFVMLHLDDGRSFQVMITDIGSQGVRLLSPPQLDLKSLPEWAVIALDSFPEPLAFLNGAKVTLAWRGLHNCGALFEKPLETPLEEIIRMLS